MVTPTWSSRELPILEAMSIASEVGDDPRRAAHEAVSDLTNELYQETLLALLTDGYVDGIVTSTADGRSTVILTRLLPKGLRAIGRWPGDDPTKEVLRTLDHLESVEVDPEKKSRMQRLRSGIEGAGTDVVAKVIVETFRAVSGRAF